MRIFYAADHEPFPGNRLWHNNLYLPLVDLGHDVVPFDYDLSPHFAHADPQVPEHRRFISANRPRLEDALLRQISAAHREKRIDLLFTYFYSAFCRPAVIEEIRRMGISTVNWYCNGSYQFHLVSDIAPAYDFCLVPERFRLDDYRRIGANPIYCQEAANPSIYRRYPVQQEYDVTFVGQKYGERPQLIRALLDAGVNVRVWGPGWSPSQRKPTWIRTASRLRRLATPSGIRSAIRKVRGSGIRALSMHNVEFPPNVCGPALSDEELVIMYSRSKISLGFSSCGNTHLTGERILQVRLRDFEAPMSGAFYMVEYMEELEEFFEVGKEIVCYHDPNDLVEKAQYFLSNETERERIRAAGHRRALADHTWQKRLSTAFVQMGLST